MLCVCCTVVVLTGILAALVCVCVDFLNMWVDVFTCGFCNLCVFLQVCGCFVNVYLCLLYFFALFRLCIFVLICFVCTGVRSTATE
jgi:hypothetical protein